MPFYCEQLCSVCEGRAHKAKLDFGEAVLFDNTDFLCFEHGDEHAQPSQP